MGWEKAWAEDFKEEAAGSEASLAMVALLKNKFLRENLKEMGPALAILLATLIISTFITEFTFNFGLKALWKTLFRFLRLSLLLTLPMYLLPGICSVMEGVFNRGKQYLIQVQEEHDTGVHPLKNWIIRPFQGIGLSMLLATKLLAFLEIYTGSKISVDTVLPSGKFEIARFLSSIAIGIVVSLLLSVLWTLDDLGIRHFNRKTREVRMIGKYIGLFLPIFFGFYGIISLFENNTQLLVAKYVGQMTVILYPPFVVFNVLHSRYLKRREEVFLKRLKAVWRSILTDDKDSASSAA
jgi:hypothetical protein